jgi:hypothetical protein
MSLIGAIPGGLLAFCGVMGGISGAQGLLMIAYFAAAAAGVILALLPVTIFTNIWPKSGPSKPKPAKAAAADKGAKGDKAAAVAEPGSEELDIAEGDEEEFVAASDEFEAVSDDQFEFEEADEFEEEEEEEK